MNAVENNEYYNLVEPHTGKIVGKQNAREIFDLIVDMAWNNGEPGIIFLDRLNKDNVTPELGKLKAQILAASNPCCLMKHAIWVQSI